MSRAPLAWFGARASEGVLATGLREVVDDPAALDFGGWWAVVATFEGSFRAARFADVRRAPLPPADSWRGPAAGSWKSSLDRQAYVDGVREVRARIARGEVYQANLCRVVRAPAPPGADVVVLAHVLAAGNPAPYAGVVDVPGVGSVCTASPELFLGRHGDRVESRPIKGTAAEASGLSAKDEAENVMIVDLVRNDLGRVCVAGSVGVPELLAVEEHPGLVHLVSTVVGSLRPGVGWGELLAATSPPGSVSGAPKQAALSLLRELEVGERGPYCGAVGWVDADRQEAVLAVGIRTFWLADGVLHFGTGAGITWGSDPDSEWRETELKAARLVSLASS
ncbi:para-aminobenzoate synthetase component 1 [Motilibacter peucedani]|uniref:Para-aminobenzoate synthetase component 1 n=1 Tax=Motilibacter peucedani TaxID=598650 RepID=A0A420XSA2_9ACTN|nr:chorismate-binding protein [Motilibacter peucedani]RKS77710.1 para-aminobenzoate synthetase component 1 [Motilibacter peucedani]